MIPIFLCFVFRYYEIKKDHLQKIEKILIFIFSMNDSHADSFVDPEKDIDTNYAVNIDEVDSQNSTNGYDPIETTNRKIFAFNDGLDKGILKPLAKGYRAIVPSQGRTAIRNFLHNLETPTVLINDLFHYSFYFQIKNIKSFM